MNIATLQDLTEYFTRFFPKKYKGFFVDVGCFHPIKYNNTYRLYRKGWRGVNIDIDAIKIEGLKYPVGPISTIANSVIVNMIKVRVAELLTQKGQPPYVLTSAQVVGVEEAKESFEGVYREHRRRTNR